MIYVAYWNGYIAETAQVRCIEGLTHDRENSLEGLRQLLTCCSSTEISLSMSIPLWASRASAIHNDAGAVVHVAHASTILRGTSHIRESPAKGQVKAACGPLCTSVTFQGMTIAGQANIVKLQECSLGDYIGEVYAATGSCQLHPNSSLPLVDARQKFGAQHNSLVVKHRCIC